jgi:hypothetical protein
MLVRLNTHIQDTDNFSFDPAVKSEAYDTVVNNDPYVYARETDKTLTTLAATGTYAIDDSIEEVFDVRIDYNANGFPESISPSYWQFRQGELNFNSSMLSYPAGKTIWLDVKRKLTSADLIPPYLQGYVLEQCTARLLDINIRQKVFRFLHNDTTLAELQNAKREAMGNARELRKALPILNSVRR